MRMLEGPLEAVSFWVHYTTLKCALWIQSAPYGGQKKNKDENSVFRWNMTELHRKEKASISEISFLHCLCSDVRYMWKREGKHKADEIVAVLKAMWYIAKENLMEHHAVIAVIRYRRG